VNHFGLIIESMVAVLLLVTIAYCILLNSRLRRLKADEQALKATIGELITATEIAERAIAGLKVTVRECDRDLGERLRTAERFSADIDGQLAAGRGVIEKLAQIVGATRPAMPLQAAPAEQVAPPAPPAASPPPDTGATLAAARAFAERARARVDGLAV
jgi:hypothetical protein